MHNPPPLSPTHFTHNPPPLSPTINHSFYPQPPTPLTHNQPLLLPTASYLYHPQTTTPFTHNLRPISLTNHHPQDHPFNASYSLITNTPPPFSPTVKFHHPYHPHTHSQVHKPPPLHPQNNSQPLIETEETVNTNRSSIRVVLGLDYYNILLLFWVGMRLQGRLTCYLDRTFLQKKSIHFHSLLVSSPDLSLACEVHIVVYNPQRCMGSISQDYYLVLKPDMCHTSAVY